MDSLSVARHALCKVPLNWPGRQEVDADVTRLERKIANNEPIDQNTASDIFRAYVAAIGMRRLARENEGRRRTEAEGRAFEIARQRGLTLAELKRLTDQILAEQMPNCDEPEPFDLNMEAEVIRDPSPEPPPVAPQRRPWKGYMIGAIICAAVAMAAIIVIIILSVRVARSKNLYRHSNGRSHEKQEAAKHDTRRAQFAPQGRQVFQRMRQAYRQG